MNFFNLPTCQSAKERNIVFHQQSLQVKTRLWWYYICDKKLDKRQEFIDAFLLRDEDNKKFELGLNELFEDKKVLYHENSLLPYIFTYGDLKLLKKLVHNGLRLDLRILILFDYSGNNPE